MTEKEFFEGYSVPRILRSYGKECFKFTDNFLRMTFPASLEVTPPSHPPQKKREAHGVGGDVLF